MFSSLSKFSVSGVSTQGFPQNNDGDFASLGGQGGYVLYFRGISNHLTDNPDKNDGIKNFRGSLFSHIPRNGRACRELIGAWD